MTAPTTLVAGLGFPEDPRWHDGRLWFSDMALGSVSTLGVDGTLEKIFDVPGRPSGLGWRPDGTLLVVSMEQRKLLAWRDGALSEVADLGAHATFHANDMVVDAKGRAYIGNFGFDFAHGEEPRPTSLVRVDPDGRVSVAADDVVFPNGTVISPDGRTMILAETYRERLTAFDIDDDGGLSNRRVFAQLDGFSPDGICLDAEGAVWVAAANTGEVIRVGADGEIVQRVPTGMRRAVACMLGGEDRRTLFICCITGLDPARNARERNGEIRQMQVDVAGAGLP
ncbi:MAG: SMP-30/gluconolactonase/LRE family protein [Candidatus Dormibacteria bacterium]